MTTLVTCSCTDCNAQVPARNSFSAPSGPATAKRAGFRASSLKCSLPSHSVFPCPAKSSGAPIHDFRLGGFLVATEDFHQPLVASALPPSALVCRNVWGSAAHRRHNVEQKRTECIQCLRLAVPSYAATSDVLGVRPALGLTFQIWP